MAVTVTGKLNKAATQFQAGESIGFGVRIGVKYYDRETKTDQWTNYEAVIFAKAPAQVQFYQSVLVEGSVIEITGTKQRIRQFQGTNGLQLSIEILEAQLGVAYSPPIPAMQPGQQQQQRPQQQQQQQGYAQQPQQQQQRPAQQAYNQPAHGKNANGSAAPNYHQGATQQPYNQPQQNFQQQNFQQSRGPAEPSIDFDDDIPF